MLDNYYNRQLILFIDGKLLFGEDFKLNLKAKEKSLCFLSVCTPPPPPSIIQVHQQTT